jgi:hypothetical protein
MGVLGNGDFEAESVTVKRFGYGSQEFISFIRR